MHELKQVMKDAGLVGDGGAGFPSYAKLAEGADTLLINGSECEPLLYTDYILMKREMPLILAGIQSVIWSLGVKRALFCVKEHTAHRLSLTDGESLGAHVFVKVMPNVYPIGDEISLIYQATGRLIKPGSLPISKGILVYNVETMYNLGRAVKYFEPVTMKWLTVGGDVKEPRVVRVPIGTSVADLFERLGIEVDEDHAVIDGGPSMGKIINHNIAEVGKTTKALLILPKNTRAVESKLINKKMAVTRAETACCQCTRCTDLCPRALLGYPLEPHKMVRTAMGAAVAMPHMVLSATLCCGCGICENLACSQGISPKAVINNYKELLAKNKLRYVANDEVYPKEEREYRMIPSKKWAQDLGIDRFDRVAVWGGEMRDFDRVELALGKYIGIPSSPAVKDGAIVQAGDIVASASAGLSVPQHASIHGRVTVTDKKIIIDRVV